MGKYDEDYRKIANERGEASFSAKDLMLFFWLSRIANEMAENNRLVRQEQSTPKGHFIEPEANVDKA